MVKKITVLLLVLFLAGCASHKKELFSKESDTLIKSPCAACKGKPFYIDGRWL